MPWSFLGVYSLLGDCGNKKDLQSRQIRLPRVISGITTAKMLALWSELEPYTNCNISFYSLTNTYTYGNTKPGANVNLDVKAKIFFKDSDTGKTHSIEIPGPVGAMFETTDEGMRVKAADVATITSAIATATSLNLIPLYGYKIQRK